jgi:hypothetical protein
VATQAMQCTSVQGLNRAQGADYEAQSAILDSLRMQSADSLLEGQC